MELERLTYNKDWNNLQIRVERGCLSPRGAISYNNSPSSTISTPLLTPSTTYLCDEPSIEFEFPSICEAGEKLHISLMQHITHQNAPFYKSKSNLSLYQTKFEMIQKRKERSNKTGYDSKTYLDRLLHSHLEFDRLFIIDFDDTLFPTTFLSRTKSTKSRTRKKRLYYAMKTLVDIIISLFDKIKSVNGKIIILTNATAGWIDDKLNGYLPGLIAPVFSRLALYFDNNDIDIISARDYFKAKYSESEHFDGEIAKTECMQSVFEEYVENNTSHKVPIVYSIGDASYEFNAALNAWDDVIGGETIAMLQRIKFVEKPNVYTLIQELETMEELVENDTNSKLIQWLVDQKYIIDYV